MDAEPTGVAESTDGVEAIEEPAGAREDFPGDPELLARWIGIAALLASSSEMHARRAGAWPALALVTADAAIEAILGLVASAGPNPPGERAGFDEVYSTALSEFESRGHRMPDAMRTRILRGHRARNLALHLGDPPAPRTVETSLRAAHDLRAIAVDTLESLAAFRDATPIQAVARLVNVEPISAALQLAEDHLSRGELDLAANYTAAALASALSRIKPRLRNTFARSYWRHQRVGKYNDPIERALQEIERALKELGDRDDRQEGWLIALGLGLQPAELARLRITLGTYHGLNEQKEPFVTREKDTVLTRQSVEWALQMTADVIFRMSQAESLRHGNRPWDD